MYAGTVETFKCRMANALSVRGMKQVDLARLTGIDSGTINNYLSGKYEPKQDRLEKIAEALHVDPVWLMGYDVPMEREKKAPEKTQLNEGEEMLLELFRQVPEERQQLVLDMIRTALKRDR